METKKRRVICFKKGIRKGMKRKDLVQIKAKTQSEEIKTQNKKRQCPIKKKYVNTKMTAKDKRISKN